MSFLLRKLMGHVYRQEEDGSGSTGTGTILNVLEMSDEDIMNMSSPPTADSSEKTEEVVENTAATANTNEVIENNAGSTSTDDNNNSNIAPIEAEGKGTATEVKADTTATEATSTTTQAKSDGEKTATEAEDDTTSTASTVDYESFYKKIMAPFRANGKMITLQSPEEAVQLMQMGANYTRKMQDIQPHRKVLLMLENNGLLDEGKLSFLIDIEKKNPEAIKKLIKEAGIDPLDIDTSTEPAYLEGNHRVTDAESNFRTTLDELSSDPTGKETIQTIHTTWDQASKEVLWNDPSIMTTIHEQRANGIYTAITTELDRQKTLGLIPAGMPFLAAYKQVGDQLATQAKAGVSTTGAPAGGNASAAVVTRVAAPKSAVTNGDKVSAATPTRSTPRKAEPIVNPLAEDDDTFMKRMKNRL